MNNLEEMIELDMQLSKDENVKNHLFIGPIDVPGQIHAQHIIVKIDKDEKYTSSFSDGVFGQEFSVLNGEKCNFFDFKIKNVVLVGCAAKINDKRYGTVHIVKSDLYDGEIGCLIKNYFKDVFKEWKYQVEKKS